VNHNGALTWVLVGLAVAAFLFVLWSEGKPRFEEAAGWVITIFMLILIGVVVLASLFAPPYRF
jgi:hypothetical protein